MTTDRQGTYLPFIRTDKYKLGLRKPKPDQKVGKSRANSDVLMGGAKANLILNHWTSIVVIRGGPIKCSG